jgi:hypothetical protein
MDHSLKQGWQTSTHRMATKFVRDSHRTVSVQKRNENQERHSLEGRCLQTICETVHVTLDLKHVPRGPYVLLTLHKVE